jgi:hypothetical protein
MAYEKQRKQKKIKELFLIPLSSNEDKVSQDSLWTMYDGTQVKFKDLESSHLLNILGLRKYRLHKVGRKLAEDPSSRFLLKIANDRKLDLKLIDTPTPFQDENGDWKIWSFAIMNVIPYVPVKKTLPKNKSVSKKKTKKRAPSKKTPSKK